MSVKKSIKSMKTELMSPLVNPLIEISEIRTKKRLVKAGRTEGLINLNTGEVSAISAIHQIEERDDAEFVKVFSEGIAASYELTKTAQRVFQVVLDQYQRTPMTKGYAEAVELFWFEDGLSGINIGMSQKTWLRGLKELIEKKFLWPKNSASYWVNPALFFKGNRVIFIKEYRLKNTIPTKKNLATQALDLLETKEKPNAVDLSA